MVQPHLVCQPFLNYLKFEKRFSEHTIVSYQTDLTAFFDYLHISYGQLQLPEITHSYIRSWLASLKDANMTAKTINRKISTLRSFFKYMMKTGALEKTPMAKIIAPKNEKRLPHFVSEKDINLLIDHDAFNTDWKGKTDRLVFLLFYNTGMRLSELINLKETGINFPGQTIRVLGKGNKERIIPVSAELIKELTLYINEKNTLFPEGRPDTVFSTVKNKKLAPRAVYTSMRNCLSLVTTIDKRSPHVMRHTFATHLLNNGAALNSVKELLGHSSLAATQVYTHNTIEKLKSVHKQAHPKA
jgi:integrase/recombinase XerC